MATQKVPTLDGSGKVRDKHLPANIVRFVDANGNPLAGKHVTIKVDAATGEIIDIVAEA